MSVDALRALRASITARKFDPVYYLHGADDFRKETAIAELCAVAVDEATRDFNVDVVRGAEADAAGISQALHSVPMLAERRVVIVREVELLRKAPRAVLDAYLSHPSGDTLLVIVSGADETADKALEGRATVVAFPTPDEHEVGAWLTQRARRIGLELTADAASLLAVAVGGDLTQAAGELDKLASFAHGRTAEVADVEALVGVRRGADMAALLDAISARSGRDAVPLVGDVLAQPRMTAVSFVAAVSTHLLALGWGRAMLDSGTSRGRLKSEYFTLLNATKPNVGRAWGEAVGSWVKHVSRWSTDDVARALDHVLTAELALKDTRTSTDAELATSLVLAVCAGTSARVAA